MALTINSVNHQSPNFGKGVNNDIKEVNAQAATKKMSTTSKVMIGLGAVATAAIATIAVKNKMAANVAKKAAQELGIDVDLYKALKKVGISEVEKVKEANLKVGEDWVDKLYSVHGDKLNGAELSYTSSEMLKKFFNDNGHNNVVVPEKAFLMSVINDRKLYGNKLIIPESYSQEFTDKVGKAFEEGKIVTQRIAE